jgi:hypothetical protein
MKNRTLCPLYIFLLMKQLAELLEACGYFFRLENGRPNSQSGQMSVLPQRVLVKAGIGRKRSA